MGDRHQGADVPAHGEGRRGAADGERAGEIAGGDSRSAPPPKSPRAKSLNVVTVPLRSWPTESEVSAPPTCSAPEREPFTPGVPVIVTEPVLPVVVTVPLRSLPTVSEVSAAPMPIVPERFPVMPIVPALPVVVDALAESHPRR